MCAAPGLSLAVICLHAPVSQDVRRELAVAREENVELRALVAGVRGQSTLVVTRAVQTELSSTVLEDIDCVRVLISSLCSRVRLKLPRTLCLWIGALSRKNSRTVLLSMYFLRVLFRRMRRSEMA